MVIWYEKQTSLRICFYFSLPKPLFSCNCHHGCLEVVWNMCFDFCLYLVRWSQVIRFDELAQPPSNHDSDRPHQLDCWSRHPKMIALETLWASFFEVRLVLLSTKKKSNGCKTNLSIKTTQQRGKAWWKINVCLEFRVDGGGFPVTLGEKRVVELQLSWVKRRPKIKGNLWG